MNHGNGLRRHSTGLEVRRMEGSRRSPGPPPCRDPPKHEVACFPTWEGEALFTQQLVKNGGAIPSAPALRKSPNDAK